METRNKKSHQQEAEDRTGQGGIEWSAEKNILASSNVPEIMTSLLEISDEQSEKVQCQARVDQILGSQDDNREKECLIGWKTVVSDSAVRKTVVNNEQKKRKSNPYTGATDIDDFYLFKKKSYISLPDYYHPGVMWRSIVEDDTYRYVADNGCYRYLKTNAALAKGKSDVKNQFQKRSIPHFSPAQQQIQREITRDLRRVVESQEKRVKSQTPKSDLGIQDNRAVLEHDLVDDKLCDPEDEPYSVARDYKNITGPGVRDKSHEGAESPFELPSMDVPLLSKAFAERLMENFSSKITALEEQIRRDAKIKMLQKSTEENCIQMRRSSLPETEGELGVTGLDSKGSFPQSTFQVIKVFKSETKVPLKPLEKVSPGMRQIEDTHKMQVAHLRYNSLKGNSDNCTRYSLSDSVINPLHLKEDMTQGDKVQTDEAVKDNCLNINNVFGAVKSGDPGLPARNSVQSQPTKKLQSNLARAKRSKSFINETIDKNSSGFHSAPVGKPKQRDYKKGVTDTQNVARRALPELMGKKMPVTVSVQKWL